MRRHRVKCTHCEGLGYTEVPNRGELRLIRERTGTSLRAMARRMGLSAPYVSDVELDRRRATPEIVHAYEMLR